MLVEEFSEKQIEKISDIISDTGLVALATVVLPAILDKFDIVKITVGISATIFLWLVSIWMRR